MEEEDIIKFASTNPLYAYLVHSVERFLGLVGDIANSAERCAVALEPTKARPVGPPPEAHGETQ